MLLDSGLDGDLLFHKTGTPKCFPYSTRQVPKLWCTLNGNFHTKEEVSYSSSNTVTVKVCNHSPNIVENDDDKLKKPVFKFILIPGIMMIRDYLSK